MLGTHRAAAAASAAGAGAAVVAADETKQLLVRPSPHVCPAATPAYSFESLPPLY